MRICLVSPEFLNGWGGVGSYCLNLAENLPSGTELHCVTLDSHESDGGKTSAWPDDGPGNVVVHRIGARRDTFLYSLGFQYAVSRIVPRLHKEHGFDVIHSNHAHMSDILLKFKENRIPSVTTVHTTLATQRRGTKLSGLAARNLDRSEKMTYLLFPLLRKLEAFYFSKTDNVICVSDFVRDRLCRGYRVSFKNCETIHNGIDLRRFAKSNKEMAPEIFRGIARQGGPKILFAGRLIALKGIHILIHSMRDILGRFPESLFMFAGGGRHQTYLSQLSGLGIPKKNFVFLGQVEKSLMPYLYALSDVYVLPSFSESCPLGILEAMASGTPVVASNVGGIPELLENNVTGLLVAPGNSQALSQAILSLLEGASLSTAMARRALDEVKARFTIEAQIRKTMAMYQRVVESAA